MILVKNVVKNFGKVNVLKNISFEVSKGEIIGFLGQNGAGKTTLMRLLTSYLPFTSGEILIDGEDVRKKSLLIRKKIGYLPENPPLYPHMNVKDYLKFAAQLKGISVKQQSYQISRVMEICNIEDVANRGISLLSKGYKQRIGIAQAIIHEPELLIFDEPFNGLDPTQIIQVRDLIKNLESKRTVILSTHILSEIEQIVKRTLIIRQGEIVVDNDLKNLIRPGDGEGKVRLIARGDRDALSQAIKETNSLKMIDVRSQENKYHYNLQKTSDLKNYNELVENIINAGGEILELKDIKFTLEDVFLKYNNN